MDDYEKTYMAGKGTVLHRQKSALPKWLFGAAAVPAGAALVTAAVLLLATSLTWMPALAIAGGGLLFGLMMSALLVLTGVSRVTVSEGALVLQMGTGGTEVPIAEIKNVSIADAGVRNRGIGKRILKSGARVYSMLGDPARAVHIERVGKPDLFLVPREPEDLLDALQRARAGAPRVRVEAGADEGTDAEPVEIEARAATKTRRA